LRIQTRNFRVLAQILLYFAQGMVKMDLIYW